MRGSTLVAVLLALAVFLPLRAPAEHLTLTPEARDGERASPGLDLQFRVGAGGFRVGARVFGDSGVYGAWLDGHVRSDGFMLDGRVQSPAGGHGFTFDSRTLETFLREAARGLPGFDTGARSSHDSDTGTRSHGGEIGAP